MSDEVLEAYVGRYLDSQPDGVVTLAWQGGEPTLRGLPFFRRVVELADQFRRPTQTVEHAIQTNGTLLDDDWAAFSRTIGSWSVSRSTAHRGCTTRTG